MSPSPAVDTHLRTVLRQLPASPGVYLMKAADGRVLYVGKADVLRHRVRSYFGSKAGLDSRIVRMISEVADVEYIVTDTVSEAFLLESNLIKEHRPRFNIRLRDDKSYPFVKITLGEDFPRIVRTRKLAQDGSRYFGPYASASSVDETLKLLRRIFPFRTCNLEIPEGKRVLERPCLLYYINRCQGPCIQAIEKAPYRATISRIVDFLEGRQEGIAAELRADMQQHSDGLRYEQAAIARDKLRAVERTIEQQKVAAYSRAEQDVIGIAREEGEACLQLFVIRNGKMIGREHFIVEGARDVTDGEVLGSFLQQYYAAVERPPRDVVVPVAPADVDGAGAVPLGPARLARDGQPAAARRQAPAGGARHAERGRGALPRAGAVARRRGPTGRGARRAGQRALGLPKQPERIECYDMSNIQGTSAVGSMVVFVNGRPEPREYRRFRIRSGETPDDFRMMAEVLRRRFRRAAALAPRDRSAVAGRRRGGRGARGRRRGGGAARPGAGFRPGRGRRLLAARGMSRWALPDLVIVDGGKGQLSAAMGVMSELDLTDVPLAGLAKRFEELYVPGRSAPIVLARGGQGALPRPAHPRRGASVRHHLSPRASRRAARCAVSSTTSRASGRHARRPSSSASAASGASARRRSRRWPPRPASRATSRSG